MTTETMSIPQHIRDLLSELDRWVQAATSAGISDEQTESHSLSENEVAAQLHALGWDAVLTTETGRWVPIPYGYVIINNPPDPHYYLQRCYHVPEGPDQWRTLWDGEREVRFTTWTEAYAFAFAHLAQEQAQLPLKRYCVRPPNTWGGDDYQAISAEQAMQMHRNYWLANGWLTPAQAVSQPLQVYEHSSRGFYCRACQHAPCKYSPAQ